MKFSILIQSIVFALSAFSLGAETKVLTVDEAVGFALKNNLNLKSSDLELEISKNSADNAWNVLFPDLSVSAGVQRANDIRSTLDSANNSIKLANGLTSLSGGSDFLETYSDKEKYHWALSGTASVSWNFNLAYINQIKAAKKDFESGKITHEKNEKELILNVKKMFYALLLESENLSIQKTSLQNAKERSEQAGTNYKAGRVSEMQYLQAVVSYENQIPQIEKAENEMKNNLRSFCFLLGLKDSEVELSGSIEPSYIEENANKLLEKYANGSLEIKEIDSQKENLSLNKESLSLSIFTPTLSVGYSVNPVHSFMNDWKDGGNWYKDNWNDEGNFYATLSWNLSSLFPWSENSVKKQNLELKLSELEIARKNALENLRISVEKAVDELVLSRRQIESSKKTLERAERSYDLYARSYRAGGVELLDLKDAEAQLNQAKLLLSKNKCNYLSALLDLENILNTSKL